MSAPRSFVPALHDTIDAVTRAVEGIHKSVADLPLDLLGRLTSLETTLEKVRGGQARSIGGCTGSFAASTPGHGS